MKKVLSKETQDKVANEVLSILVKNKCTLSDFYEVSQRVHASYVDNATLPMAVVKATHNGKIRRYRQ